MEKRKVRQWIEEIGVVPVVRASSARDARIAADAVCEGGIPIVEITMTVPGAVDVIRELTKSVSGGVFGESGAEFASGSACGSRRKTNDGGSADADGSDYRLGGRLGFRESVSLRAGRRREVHQSAERSAAASAAGADGRRKSRDSGGVH